MAETFIGMKIISQVKEGNKRNIENKTKTENKK